MSPPTASSAQDLQSLVDKRGRVKASLSRFQTYLNISAKADNVNFGTLEERLHNILPLMDKFEDIHAQIVRLAPEADDGDPVAEFENTYYAAISQARELLAKNKVQTQEVQKESLQSHVRLPRIDLPKFNGSYDQWLPFYDTFKCLIHEAKEITDIQKFHYLKSTLQGEAKGILDSLEISSDNYAVAWNLLKSRYDNERLIAKGHLRALFDLPSATKESYSVLRKIVDDARKHLQALKALKRPVSTWDDLMIYLITSKLDSLSCKEWEGKLGKTHPSLEELITFLEHKCQTLECVGNSGSQTANTHNNYNFRQQPRRKVTAAVASTAKMSKCALCSQDHALAECQDFLRLPAEQRVQEVRIRRMCTNCLKPGHMSFRCFVTTKCRYCHKRHHSSLHLNPPPDNNAPVPLVSSAEANPGGSTSNNHIINNSCQEQVILSTALIKVRDNDGNTHVGRALLDSGAESNFIRADFARKLNLPLRQINVSLIGVNEAKSVANHMVKTNVASRFNAFNASIDCIVLQKITSDTPTMSINQQQFNFPANIKLADPSFHKSGPIDILIGASLFWNLLCVGQIRSDFHPLLQKTQLGWIVAGKASLSGKVSASLCNLVTNEQINKMLEKFWTLDEPLFDKIYTNEENMCEKYFKETVRRNKQGRFVVKLPFKTSPTEALGDSKGAALKRFYALERKLERQPLLKKNYTQFMREYLNLGHMRVISDSESESPGYWLPHHAVFKSDSLTTKTRVVFDASAKTTTNVSLNDVLMVGPTIQEELFNIILRFRTYKYVLTADIAKMYRQVLIDESETSFQRIFWRENSTDNLLTYELKTVTYGTAPAAFLAIRCLHQVASDVLVSHPRASEIIKTNFYVDDLLTGANSKEELVNIRNEVKEVLSQGGFELRKWSSNNPEILKGISSDSENAVLYLDKNEKLKTLGLFWGAYEDVLQFSIPQIDYGRRISKRTILSETAQCFDPLGLISPIIVRAKLLIQELWQLKVEWDESVPIRIHTFWSQYRKNLPRLSDLKIARRAIWTEKSKIVIHGFCDASEVAYGACIYACSMDEAGVYHTNLLCSKTRVAPLKCVTLPRLELCGAVLLAELMQKTRQCFKFHVDELYYWTDSKIVLSWINAEPKTWNTFVANRVAQIQKLTETLKWNHVQSVENPADILSRGCTPQELLSSNLWWYGPEWLKKEINWPMKAARDDFQEMPEKRRTAVAHITLRETALDYERFSSFNKLLRVVAYCARFCKNCQSRPDKRIQGSLTAEELQHAMSIIIKDVQREDFNEEIEQLTTAKGLKASSRLICLNPFIDADGIIRVGGRLRKSQLDYGARHQVLLPSKHHVTYLIIKHEHIKQLHVGMSGTLAAVRNRFWPLAAKSTIRKIVRNCVICFKCSPRSSEQIMGNLPQTRVQASRPFLNCGIDYFGPLNLKQSSRRNSPTCKAYGAVFLCFATKAVHCELVSSLSSEAFINAFKRFIARRGKVSNVYTDNGTNFVGANRELKELYKTFASSAHVQSLTNTFAEDGIKWHFIPPNSPHFGGLWEAAVKSFKFHIKRIMGKASLTFEEMCTLLIQIESVLNSRPLCPLSDDPNDFSCLTPGHFLIGESLISIPEPSLLELPLNRLSRWQYVERLRQHFWKRWHQEYLNQLQVRNKWKVCRGQQLTPGQLVLVRDENQPPLFWAKGRIVKVHPGDDGFVRTATVKTAKGIILRAASRLCVLPVSV